MALPLTKPVILPLAEERRRHQRVKVNLLGRYRLADRREFPCQVVDMSPGGMALIAPIAVQPGERVIAYVDHSAGLRERSRVLENGFAMTIAATLRKRDKLAAQLTWLANRKILNLPEDRRHDRFTPRNAMARLVLPNGTKISPDLWPPVDVVVTVGKTQGRVVRQIEDGFAIEFMRLQHARLRRRQRHR